MFVVVVVVVVFVVVVAVVAIVGLRRSSSVVCPVAPASLQASLGVGSRRLGSRRARPAPTQFGSIPSQDAS